MIKRGAVIAVLSFVVLTGTSLIRSTHSAGQDPRIEEHQEWVGKALKTMETIQPGMTRKDLLRVFTTEGGLSTGLRRTYVSRECAYFKVDVEFEAFGRPDRDEDNRVTIVEDERDVILKISRPYLQFSILD
jgi:hypothetical protein